MPDDPNIRTATLTFTKDEFMLANALMNLGLIAFHEMTDVHPALLKDILNVIDEKLPAIGGPAGWEKFSAKIKAVQVASFPDLVQVIGDSSGAIEAEIDGRVERRGGRLDSRRKDVQ